MHNNIIKDILEQDLKDALWAGYITDYCFAGNALKIVVAMQYDCPDIMDRFVVYMHDKYGLNVNNKINHEIDFCTL